MAHVILERSFDPPLTDAVLEDITARLWPCLEPNGVRWIRSHMALDGARLICEFDAPDAEAIRTALRTARLDYERVWTGVLMQR